MSISIDIIPSKSYAHRQLVAAALSETPCSVVCDFASEDIEATRKCLAALEPSLSGRSGNKGLTASAPETDSICTLPCGESGSTLRFLLPLAGALGTKARFLTQGRLAERPMDPLRDELTVHGCSLSEPGVSPITIEGQLTPGTYMLPGNVSSQFITGLLLALPLLKKKSTLVVTGKLQSSPYIDITLDVLKQFGIQIEQEVRESGRTYEIPGNQHYQGPERVITEGDWSGAAFWLAAGAIGSEAVTVRGLNPHSMQGDRRIADVLKDFGASVLWSEGEITAEPSHLHGITVDISEIPDLAPAVALTAAVAEGTTRIVNGLRLRMKESDRIRSICASLKALGADITEEPEGMTIQGTGGRPLEGGACDSFGDHRIAMMEAIASLVCRNPVNVSGSEAVRKSYPGFFQVMEEKGMAENLRAEEMR